MARRFSLARNATAAIAVGVLLTGCLVPETIDANIVLEGYEYDLRVETRLADPRVVKALADGHVLTEQEEDRMKSQADNFLSIRRMGDGTIEVSTPEIPVRARAELDQIAIVPNGTLTVTVSGTVIETNADETPGFFGGSYRWNISSWDDRVFLKVDPAVD